MMGCFGLVSVDEADERAGGRDVVLMSGIGTFRTWRDVSLESVMRLKADLAEDDFHCERGPTESRVNRPPISPSIARHRVSDRSRGRQIGYFPDRSADRQQPLRK